MDLFNYSRRETTEVNAGVVPLGGLNSIRVQSMTNMSTQDAQACVEQVRRIVDVGGEYIRLTIQGIKEAENLMNTNIGLRSQGYTVSLVADVRSNPRVTDVAAQYAEKVRINPGNYVDTAHTFKKLEYTDEEYVQEIQKIHDRFVPFPNTCKENHTAIRARINHGSLPDCIISHYGDTPAGMVESCMEFLRICVEENFTDVVISVKASDTVVMVKTVRLLVDVMEKERMAFPLHLGVTEVGGGEDGRIKSTLGTGTLLSGGLGDTTRVSLSEIPEAEIPVVRKLADYVLLRQDHPYIPGLETPEFNYLLLERRETKVARNIGGEHAPVVIADHMDGETEVNPQFIPNYIYAGKTLSGRREDGVEYILDADVWQGEDGTWPAFNHARLPLTGKCNAEPKFLFMPYMARMDEVIACPKHHPEVVIVSQSNHPNRLGEYRALAHQLMTEGLQNPVASFQHYPEDDAENLQIKPVADMGALTFDGLCDGIFPFNQSNLSHAVVDATAFGILQARHTRTSKTEYIFCPGCGRILYNLEKTIARIEVATSHLKGLKIGIMGCIVNGPGEMADADYGYVGAGQGKISLHKGKVYAEKSTPEEEVVERFLEFVRTDREESQQ